MGRASGSFDPYHKWLGIPAGKRSPTLYQLLGLQIGESDTSVIEAAAARQMAYVARFLGGPDSKTASRLLSEIDQARFTLLDPDARRKYNASLKAKAQRSRGTSGNLMPPRMSGQSVGEESGLGRELGKIMAVIVAGFLVILTATFYFWDRTNKPIPALSAAGSAPGVTVEPGVRDAPPVIEEKFDPPVNVEAASVPWLNLISGTSLDEWKLHSSDIHRTISQCWAVRDNVLTARRSGHNWLRTKKPFRDFVLAFDWRFPAGADTAPNGGGIVIRSSGVNESGLDPTGVEIDIRPNSSPDGMGGTGCLIAYDAQATSHTTTCDRTTSGGMGRKFGWKQVPNLRSADEWNTCKIDCRADRLVVEMNGAVVNEAWDLEPILGYICIRSQDSEIEYRNVRIQNLDDQLQARLPVETSAVTISSR